jgi:hypothetical protein
MSAVGRKHIAERPGGRLAEAEEGRAEVNGGLNAAVTHGAPARSHSTHPIVDLRNRANGSLHQKTGRKILTLSSLDSTTRCS